MRGHAEEDFHQLKLHFIDPIQHDYELIRPIVLFGAPVTERSQQTDIARTTISDKARRFVQQGMLGLVEQRAPRGGRKPHVYPEPIANYILYLKHLYPPIHYREIVRILERKFGYTTNHHTVKRFLARYTIPEQLALPLPPTFHTFDDAYQARWTVVRMFYEGWERVSIAGYLKLSERHVRRILDAFEQDGFAGLEDKRTRPADHPHNQLTLPLLHKVFELQREYPRAGRFRIHGLLTSQHPAREKPLPSERTVGRMMAINRQFHQAPGPWPSPPPQRKDEPRPLPYAPLRPHQFWFIDVRYLVKLDGHWIYSICVLEGYSRKILAGMACDYQDLVAVLQLLCAAISEYGRPDGLVSDNGGAFSAHDYAAFLQALDIEPCFIDRGQPWENLIESQFLIQVRLGDAKFEQAYTLEDLQAQHAAFIETFNTTAHSAHQERTDGRHTPAEVLGWVQGRPVDHTKLQQVVRDRQFLRTVNRHGFVSVQRFYIYAERGLAKRRVAVWVYDGDLRIAYQQTLLAHYHCQFDRRQKQLQTVGQPTLYRTAFASPQLEFWELDDDQWVKVLQQPIPPRRTRRGPIDAVQLPLLGVVALLVSSQLTVHMRVQLLPYLS
jgi:transposase InsO family protein/transposase